jgi:hypothetical protein
MFQLRDNDWRDCVLRSWARWKDYALLPYNWHTLTETRKWQLLRAR